MNNRNIILTIVLFLFVNTTICFAQKGKKNSKFPKYEYVGSFNNGLAKVKYNKKWGFIDTLGVEIVPCIYHEVTTFNDGFAKVRVNEKWGLVDTSGNVIIKPTFDWIYDFEGDRAKVLINGEEYYMNKSGQRVK
jgi:hypothetical protein